MASNTGTKKIIMSEIPTSDYERKVTETLIDQLLVQVVQTAKANLFLITVVGVVVWWNLETPSILWWMSLGYVITLGRFLFLTRIKKYARTENRYIWLERAIYIALSLSGIHWGMAAFLYLDLENPELFVFVLFAILGVVCATLASLTIRPLVWFAFTATTLSLTIGKLFILGTWELAAMGLGLTAFLSFVGKNLGARIKKSITQDIRTTELLEEVSAAKEQAEQANLKKSLFMAATSHDLRQPLHAQSLLLDSLARKTLDHNSDVIVQKIIRSNEALISLFDSLLEISQLDAGTVTVYKASHSLTDICKNIVDEFQELANQKGLVLSFRGVDVFVESDSVLLSRVLRNLISNAIKFTESGGVDVTFSQSNDNVFLEVSDTGIGIPKNELKRIFSEFTQLNNKTRDRSKGIGLGLAVVHRLCELLDHKLEVHSEIDKGSRFGITLPISQYPATKPIEEEITVVDLTGLKVLILDDEYAILDAMQSLLHDWSCITKAFANHNDAISCLVEENFSPDLILSDYRLEENFSGVDAIESMRVCLGRQVPAILISGDTDPKLLDQLKNEDFYLLHKPVKAGKLRNTMRKVCAPEGLDVSQKAIVQLQESPL